MTKRQAVSQLSIDELKCLGWAAELAIKNGLVAEVKKTRKAAKVMRQLAATQKAAK